MRKLSFRFLSALLAVFMLVSTASTIVFAEGEEAVDPVSAEAKAFYNDTIVDWDFEDATLGADLSNGDEYLADDTKKPIIKEDTATAEGENDFADGQMVYVGTDSAYFGIPTAKIQSHSSYDSATGYPKKVKLAFDLKKKGGSTMYLQLNSTTKSNANELMAWSYETNFKFATKEGRQQTILTKEDGTQFKIGAVTWIKFELYFDFAEGVYHIYSTEAGAEQEEYKYRATCTIPDSMADGIESVVFMSSATGHFLVDNLSLSAYGALDIVDTNIKTGDTNVNTDLKFVATFNKELADVDKSMVEVTGGTTPAVYKVSNNEDKLVVTFPAGLETSTNYTITLKKTITAADGNACLDATSVSFTTSSIKLAGYSKEIASLDFDNFNPTTITSSKELARGESEVVTVKDKSGKGYDFYLLTSTGDGVVAGVASAEIKSEKGRGNIFYLPVTGQLNPSAGIAASSLGDFGTGTLPQKFKLEFDAMISTNTRLLYASIGSAELIRFKAGSGYSLTNTTPYIQPVYTAGEWVNLAFYFDTVANTVEVYVDGKYLAQRTKGVSSYASSTNRFLKFTSNGSNKVCVDNIKISAYETFDIESTSIENGATYVDPATDEFVATFSQELGNAEGAVEVAGTSDYTVSTEGKKLIVNFSDRLATSTEYTVTIKSSLKNADGVSLGKDVATQFTTDSISKSSYSTKIVDWTFDDIAADTVITGGDNDETTVTGTSGDQYKFYVTKDKSASIKAVEGKGNVLEITASGQKDPYAGATLGDYATNMPEKYMIEFDTRAVSIGTSSKNVYFELADVSNAVNGQLFRVRTTSGLTLDNGTTYFEPKNIQNNEWVTVTLYVDTAADTVTLYSNGVYRGSHTPLVSGITDSSPKMLRFTSNASGNIVQVDNLKLYAYNALIVDSTSIAKNATGVSNETKTFTATFNKDLGEVSKSQVVVASTDGGNVPAYTVTKEGKVLTATFKGGFTAGKTYTITLKSGIKAADGKNILEADDVTTFTTSSAYDAFGFNKTIVSFNAADYKDAGSISPTTSNQAGTNGEYVVPVDKTLPIIKLENEKFEYVAKCSAGIYIGMNRQYQYSKKAYHDRETDAYPKLVKLEFDFKGSNASAISMELYLFDSVQGKSIKHGRFNTNGTNHGYYFSDGDILAQNNSAGAIGPKRSEGGSDWHNIKMYFDFNSGKYRAIIDDNPEWQKTYTIPTGITDIRGVYFAGYDSSTYCYLANFTLSTVDAYDKDKFSSGVICEYASPMERGMGFVYSNKGEADKTIKVIEAQYNSEGLLVGTVVTPKTVTAATSVFEKLSYPTNIPEDGSVKYFVWEGFDTMKPVTTPKALN